MRRLVFLAVVALSFGCSRGTTGAGGGPDFGFTLDLAMIADLAPRSTVGIACGATACAAQAQNCCSADVGQTGSCVPANMSCPANNATFGCDGPEDCPPFMPQCCFTGTVSSCQDTGACQSGVLLCHADKDCTSPAHCCPVPHSPYGQCSSVPCP
jgi:hypothetical protein